MATNLLTFTSSYNTGVLLHATVKRIHLAGTNAARQWLLIVVSRTSGSGGIASLSIQKRDDGLGLPDAFCENTGHFVNSDKSRLHS